MSLEFHILRSPVLLIDGIPVEQNSPKLLALLAYLVVERGYHTRELLSTLLWADSTQDRAFNNLRQVLHRLRTVLPDGTLEITRSTVGISNKVELWTDFEVLKEADNDESLSFDSLAEVYELDSSDFMAGFSLSDSLEFESWQMLQRQKVNKWTKDVGIRLVNLATKNGDFELAQKYANQLTQKFALDEYVHRFLMHIYVENNQPHAALHQYKIATEKFERELGLAPSSEMQAIYKAILNTANTITPESITVENVLPPRPQLVVGRDKDINQLLDMLQTYNVVAIQGWPGVGKSTLAATLAYDPRITMRFPDGVLWTALHQNNNGLNSLKLWAKALGMSNDVSDKASIIAWLREWLADKQTLLIIDDVWDAETIHDFRIGGDKVRTLLTTRENAIASQLTNASQAIYRLPILNESDSLSLLQQLAPDVVAAHPAESQMLVRSLEGLPLTLQVAGRLLQAEFRMGWGIQDLLEALHEGNELLRAQAPQDMTDDLSIVPPTVASLLAQSTNRLSVEYQRRFAALGVFSPKPATFSIEALTAIWRVSNPRDTIRLFVARGLMEPAGSGRFQVHALLIAHARSLFTG